MYVCMCVCVCLCISTLNLSLIGLVKMREVYFVWFLIVWFCFNKKRLIFSREIYGLHVKKNIQYAFYFPEKVM